MQLLLLICDCIAALWHCVLNYCLIIIEVSPSEPNITGMAKRSLGGGGGGEGCWIPERSAIIKDTSSLDSCIRVIRVQVEDIFPFTRLKQPKMAFTTTLAGYLWWWKNILICTLVVMCLLCWSGDIRRERSLKYYQSYTECLLNMAVGAFEDSFYDSCRKSFEEINHGGAFEVNDCVLNWFLLVCWNEHSLKPHKTSTGTI